MIVLEAHHLDARRWPNLSCTAFSASGARFGSGRLRDTNGRRQRADPQQAAADEE